MLEALIPAKAAAPRQSQAEEAGNVLGQLCVSFPNEMILQFYDPMTPEEKC